MATHSTCGKWDHRERDGRTALRQFPVRHVPRSDGRLARRSTQAVALPLGESFQFSFQASSAPSLTQFGDLVGPATGSSGSTSDFQSTNDALFGGIQMFSHPFTSRGDSAAGVAFNMNSFGAAATVCFDNVALQQIEGVSS